MLAEGARLHVDAVLVDPQDRRLVLPAAAVEDDERVARAQAKGLAYVVGGVLGKGKLGARTEAKVAEDARGSHGEARRAAVDPMLT